MADFIEKHWHLINWPTALIAVAVFTPIAVALFYLIANHSKESLKSEVSAHYKTKQERDNLAEKLRGCEANVRALQDHIKKRGHSEAWRDVELTDEEILVLSMIAAGDLRDLYRSKNLSNQRICLAQDRLLKVGFVAWGTESIYAKSEGREWLNARGLLK